jgi:flagellar hook-associated protein 3 FlgL
MTVGDALFARLATRGFSELGNRIGDLQARVASGVNDPRASADPARAIELSALRDVRARLAVQEGAARSAADRLAMTDQTLASVSDGMRQLSEIALRAANDTLTSEAHAALRAEVETLRGVMLSAANASDMAGRPLFSGTAPGPAFAAVAGGGAAYHGNDAAPVAQVGDSTRLSTGLPGSRVFGEGAEGVFALLDDMMAALTEPTLSARPEVRAAAPARLEPVRTRAGETIEITLQGPVGAARVTLDLRLDAPAAPVNAINALTAQTGITAQLEPNGRGIRLESAGEIVLSGQVGGGAARPWLTLGALDGSGQPAGPVTGLRPDAVSPNSLVARTSAAVEHMATMRAAAGSLAEAVDRGIEAISARRLTVDQAVSRLEDLDVAATLTRLQSLLLSEQASQQTFVKITGQSLFNFLR